MPKSDFHKACDGWYAVADADHKFGSSDTEPRAEFADVVQQLARGNMNPKIPRTPQQWQLFTGEGTGRGAGLMAANLTRATRKVVAAAQEHLDDVRAYMDYVGWRY